MIIAGSISGTSIDGIDVAVAELTGIETGAITLRPIHAATYPWSDGIRDRLLAALPPGSCDAGELCELDVRCGQEIGAAISLAVRAAGVAADLIVSHGQTIFHWVRPTGVAMGCIQLGQPAYIVQATGLPVVSDLRNRDIAAGGQGAPLAGTMDGLLLRSLPAGSALLNLGGIANVTVLQGDSVLAFDTGPANCLIDLAVQARTGQAYDRDGFLAATGTVDILALTGLLNDPYFSLEPPKSTGREHFDREYVAAHLAGLSPLSDADLVATLTEFTAVTVADSLRPFGIRQLYASGGGAQNPAMLARIEHHLGAPVSTTAALGLDPDTKEGYLMALLGYLTWYGVPGVLSGMTGSATPRVLGRISPGDQPLRLPEPAEPPTRLTVT
ncbi:anhydro-N-acetylmuramic acid kinase [Branchiibius hedensis]|uniref:Anhydro-N-acetylmuramic acid kinase n=1 Tax=Branchiibius hedensis TaxID=672460 RepID=A0A2Y8ZXC8_9MICO|nr:anhydro-N-acetylmuramic acid kinase [Branchiibius hedensis]PWJ27137.1 anhydro-N-acetylmuramic acid kinase [Branchiibius hedensis]SSA35948.1 anhydro-N-acetylmuramic acid kinase [Branchiibius hedensis]